MIVRPALFCFGAVMVSVTPNTPFRETGNTDRASFCAHLSRTQSGTPSPVAPEADAIYDVLAPLGLTRLGAAIGWIERSNETNPADLQYYGRELHNLFAVKNPPAEQAAKGVWRRYPSYAAAAADWGSYILGPVYQDLKTIAELIGRYAPWSDGNNPDNYGRRAAELIQALPLLEEESSVSDLDPWRPYPYPKMVDLLVTKPGEGAGFDRVAPRRDKIRGFCTHITDGVGSIEGIQNLFSVGGERAWDALTDLTIGRDGRIGLLNDWRNPDRGGRRAGWANGGVDGLEGDGVAFYRAYPDINVRLVSCEHIARAGEAWTDAEIAASIEIRTAVAQELKCPWDTYPIHPGFGGISIEQQHRNFATKSCPANPYINTYDAAIKREVKAKLKAWQGGVETPTPVPAEPPTFTVYGMREDQLSYLFGSMTRVNDDGSTDELPFSPTGPLSLLWMQRCEREGIFPEAEELRPWDSKLANGREWFATWEGGWTAWLPIDNQRAGWQWLSPTPAVAKAA